MQRGRLNPDSVLRLNESKELFQNCCIDHQVVVTFKIDGKIEIA